MPSSPTSSIVHAAAQLLLRPSIAPTAAHFLRKLCSAGGPEAANAVLGSAALPAALPLLLAADAPSADSAQDGDFEGGDLQQEHPAAPIRATLVAVTSMLLSTPTPRPALSSSAASSSSVVSGGPASSKPAADADPAALDALRHAATSVLTRAAGSSAASHVRLSRIEAAPVGDRGGALPRPRAAAKSVMAPAKSAEASAEAGGCPP